MTIERAVAGRNLQLLCADITTLNLDAIVNAANASLAGGGGVDGAIHRAGGPEIMAQCRKIGRCPTGHAVVTTGGRLPARYVIHAVAPRYHGRAEDASQLASAYRSSLDRATELNISSIAFPSLGTGAYGYPIAEAATIALRTVIDHLEGTNLDHVVFALFSGADLEEYHSALSRLVG